MDEKTAAALAYIGQAIDLQNQIDQLRITQLSQLQRASAVLQVMGGDVKVQGVLGVPWVGQNVREISTDDFSNNDCGPACLTMWLNYLEKRVTVDDVSKSTGLSRGYTYTLPGHLMAAAKAYGLPLNRVTNIGLSTVKANIDNNDPVVVLVHYASLPKRSDPNFKAGHWIIVTGYDNDGITYNDPLWQDETGKALKMTWAEFDKAMADCAIDGNTPRQGLVAA